MNHRPKVTVVGSFNTDLMVRTPRMPVKGETILGGPFLSGPGGKGANQAVAAARLGAEVTMLVKLGKDAFGDLAQANLEKEGILPKYILRSAESHTGVAFIIVDDTGENMIVVAGGTNDRMTTADVDIAREAICTADIVLMQLEVPLAVIEYTARMADEAGVKVMLNPAPGQRLPADLLKRIDYLTPNETEAELITGQKIASVEDAQLAARDLLASGVGTAVITLGSNGALVVTSEKSEHVPGQKVQVVDTTGAGDAFNGAFAVALAEGKGLAEAAAFANVAAAIQVTRLGTAPAMPFRQEVEDFLAKVKA